VCVIIFRRRKRNRSMQMPRQKSQVPVIEENRNNRFASMQQKVYVYEAGDERAQPRFISNDDAKMIYGRVDTSICARPIYDNKEVKRPYSYGGDENENSKLIINEENFESIIPRVELDEMVMFKNQALCMICNQGFDVNPDVRTLRCLHAFHANCIYFYTILSKNEKCPVCSAEILGNSLNNP
jgi:hypothetical protein